VLFKKIDTTMRGNVAAEINAIMDEAGLSKAIVCPAFPGAGRTVVDGLLLVNGAPLDQTDFRAPTAIVREILQQGGTSKVASMALDTVEKGSAALRRAVDGMTESIVVCDAVTQAQLRTVAQAAELAGGEWLLCGSGGLARELRPGRATAQGRQESRYASGPGLVVFGSRSEAAGEQLRRARDVLRLPVLEMDFAPFTAEAGLNEEVVWMLAEARRLLRNGKRLALSAHGSDLIPGLAPYIPGIMAEVAWRILGAETIGGVMLSGGDVAEAVCRRLGGEAIVVEGEIEPGVPFGHLVGGQYTGMRLVTKAGGLGSPEAIVESMPYLEQGAAP
jgi:uncharacterized protein YgbK (DUF1537 family)